MILTENTLKTGTLVYHYENGHFPIYVVMFEHDGKYDLALPWTPHVTELRNVDARNVEPVFEEELQVQELAG